MMNDENAIINVVAIIQRQEPEIWNIFSATASRWFANNYPEGAGDMVELQGVLETKLTKYLDNLYPDDWSAISYEQQLIEQAQTVGRWFAEQWYEARKTQGRSTHN